MSQCGMRLMEERHVPYQVDMMVWCNRLDLIALSNFKGEVQVHRLHWQKVWSLVPPKETSKVTGMAWRPDGKALAVGYSCGQVVLVDVEDKETLHSFTVVEPELLQESEGVTCLAWSVKSGELMSEYNAYEDANLFLSTPIPSNVNYKGSKLEESNTDFKKLEDQNQLHILIFGYGNGNVHLSVFGKFPCGVINIPKMEKLECEVKILNAQLSEDFKLLQVLYVDSESNSLKLVVVDTLVLSDFHQELFLLANKYSHIAYFMSYISQTMTSIIEAWEHILLEMETKLANYAALVPEGGVSADLLDLLMTGVASDELELFLLQELTDKGLKKIGSSVELSYSIIQKLVTKQLNVVSQSLIYFLNELRGLSRIPDRYEILGLEEKNVSNAIKATFAFMSKSLELQQVISQSMRDYKSFFRWLYVVILKLLEEPISCDIVKINQQELTYIAEFLYNFDNVNVQESDTPGKKAVKFNLEKLAQYLEDKELTILPDDGDNPWKKFLKENPCLTVDNDTIFSLEPYKQYSLVMQTNHLKDAISHVFQQSGKAIGNHYILAKSLLCCQNQLTNIDKNYKLTQIYQNNSNNSFLAFIDAAEPTHFCFIEISRNAKGFSANGAFFYFMASDILNESRFDAISNDKFIVADLQFYSSEILSIIVRHPNDDDISVFIQLPVNTALEKCYAIDLDNYNVDIRHSLPKQDASDLLAQGVYKIMDKMSANKLAVSGGRKVAVVLSTSNRKVRIFEMEVDGDEEEDETLDTTPQSQGTAPPSDLSQHNISIAGHTSANIINQSLEEEIECDISDETPE